MTPKASIHRRIDDYIVKGASALASAIGVFFLGWIIFEVAYRGYQAINFDFFTQLPAPPGTPGGGLGNAILGTLIMTGLATIFGVGVGVMAGVYLSEFGKDHPFASAVRFAANALMGTPSIIVGVFVYSMIVVRFGHFSAWAGALSLGIIMLPVISRTTEDMLALVPSSIRESALALGAPAWKATVGIVFRSAKSGLVTGILLAVARVSGETAPLLFTSLNSAYWPRSLNEPIANLTVTIFNYAMSPFEEWQTMAWGASLMIMVGVLGVNVFTRLIMAKDKGNAR